MLERAGGSVKAAALKALRANVYQSIDALLDDGSSRTTRRPRLGLAVSGGVDSMALATICSCYWHGVERDRSRNADFSGFIVDHGYRSDSGDEADRVAANLRRLGIEPRILKLDWSAHGHPRTVPHFENAARRLRYQAIGRACLHENIPFLLVAHHADDQAETVLARVHQKWFGHGLKGIKPVATFPECDGIYGIDGSGAPRHPAARSLEVTSKGQGIGVEGGGLRVYRPLLRYAKEELIAICHDRDVEWFEDHTNANKTLTLRNAIRHLRRQDVLPAALGGDRLTRMSDGLLKHRERHEQEAAQVFQSIPVSLNLAFGEARFTLHDDSRMGRQNRRASTAMGSESSHYLVRALVLRKLLYLVSPHRDISLADLDEGLDFISRGLDGTVSPSVQVAGVNIRLFSKFDKGRVVYSLTRARPRRHHIPHVELSWPRRNPAIESEQPLRWSEWLLWDNRYWIRVGRDGRAWPDPDAKISVTFLTPRRLSALAGTRPARQAPTLPQSLHGVPREIQNTLPAIIAQYKTEHVNAEPGASPEDAALVALPSIGWNNPASSSCVRPQEHGGDTRGALQLHPGWVWEIRYRAVDFNGPHHEFVNRAALLTTQEGPCLTSTK